MKTVRLCARVLLIVVFVMSCCSFWLAPHPFAKQFRDHPNATPSTQFPLGTDDLGRDRLSRLWYGTSLSLLLAPAAAAFALVVALAVGGSAGLLGGWWDLIAMKMTDLFLSLPWLFLFLTVRALLPLNEPPFTSILITFGLLGMLGWAAAARVIRASVLDLRRAGFTSFAKACGISSWRTWRTHLLPHLRVLLFAQFWVLMPMFILGEASLGLLGLGVSEPLPSWGNMLRELESVSSWNQPWVFAPVAVLAIVMVCFQLAHPREGWA